MDLWFGLECRSYKLRLAPRTHHRIHGDPDLGYHEQAGEPLCIERCHRVVPFAHPPPYPSIETWRFHFGDSTFDILRATPHNLVMSLSEQLTTDLKTAMKAKDSATLTVVRSLKTALTNATIEKAGAGGQLDPAAEIAIVRTAIKQRQDSFEKFEEGGRQELADNEKAEIAVLERYLPAGMCDDEVAALIDSAIAEVGATSRKEMGQVMKLLQEKAAGRVDNKTLSSGVAQRLS